MAVNRPRLAELAPKLMFEVINLEWDLGIIFI